MRIVSTMLVFLSLLGLSMLPACGESTAPATADATSVADTVSTADTATCAPQAAGITPDALPPFKPAPPWRKDAQVPNACQGLAADWDCLTPFPSDWYRQGDGQVRVPPVALPQQLSNDPTPIAQPIDFQTMFPQDGAPILPQIAVRFPAGVDPAPVVPPYVNGQVNPDFSPSTKPTSTTLLIDADTLQPVPHFGEIDPRAEQPKDRMLLVRPVVPLQPGRRYIAAIRKGIKDLQGAEIVPPALFGALRDQLPLPASATATADETLRKHFDEAVFAPLAQFGVDRKDLLLAWDFTTRTDASATGDMLAVRAQALAVLDKMPLDVKVLQVIDAERKELARRVEGELTVPMFVDGTGAGARLLRDGAGKPVSQGFVKIPFSLMIPPSVWSGKVAGPARVLQFGHGFFGSRQEAWDSVVPKLLDQAGMVGMAVDWWGMSTPDAGNLVVDLVSNPSQGLRFVERVHQGMVNQLALTWAARKGLWDLPELRPATAKTALADGQHVYFYGISQGHILGGTQVALNPWIDKAVLAVGGGGFGLMMSRAAPFEAFLALLEGAAGSKFGATRLTLLMAGPLERIDPLSYAAHLRADTLPGSVPSREVLMHCGLADTQVPNLANHVHARALGLPLLQPSPRVVYGLKTTNYPASSGLVEFDFHLAALDVTAQPPPQLTPVHETVRTLQASIQQIDRFLRPCGQVEQTCDGVCDPE